MWSVELLADPKRPPIGRAEFRVDAFVPDRMAVEADALRARSSPGQPYPLPVFARFLYGAPAADLTGSASLRLTKRPGAAPGARRLPHRPRRRGVRARRAGHPASATDKQGTVDAAHLAQIARRTARARAAELDIAVDDPSGAPATPSHDPGPARLRPHRHQTGVRDGAIDAGAEAKFDVAAVEPGWRAHGDAGQAPPRARAAGLAARDARILARYETV